MQGRTIIATVGQGLVRWLAAFGQCPSPERDPGLCVWHHLRPRARPGPPLLGGGGPLVDDPHLAVGTGL